MKLVVFALTLLFISACESNDTEIIIPQQQVVLQPTEYRDQVVGNYMGTRTESSWLLSSGYHDTTFSFSFDIVKDTAANKIIIDNQTIFIDSNYHYELYYPNGFYIFNWVNDTATISYQYGSPGSSFSVLVSDKKQ